MLSIELQKKEIDAKTRHQCSSCYKRRYEDKMHLIYYPLLHKKAWHCKDCISKNEIVTSSVQSNNLNKFVNEDIKLSNNFENMDTDAKAEELFMQKGQKLFRSYIYQLSLLSKDYSLVKSLKKFTITQLKSDTYLRYFSEND